MKKLLSSAYESAKTILCAHRDQLERVAHELLKRESLDEQAFRTLLEPVPTGSPPSLDGAVASNGKTEEGPFAKSDKNILDIQGHRN